MLRPRRKDANVEAPPPDNVLIFANNGLPSSGATLYIPAQAGVPTIPEEPVDLGKVKRQGSPASKIFAKKIKAKELMHFSRQMAAFLRAGIPILDALEMLQVDLENPTLATVVHDIETALRQGSSLGDSLDSHPKAFPIAYRSMVRSAELTGNLDIVLDRLAAYIERDQEAKDKLKSALTYPAVIGVLGMFVVLLLTIFVLPKFKPFFKSFHTDLPAPTKALMFIGDATQHYWWAIVIVIGGIIGGAMAFVRGPKTRIRWHRILLKLPLIGAVMRYSIVERFCRVLASMLQAGVPVPEAMKIAAAAANNLYAQGRLDDARAQVMQGAGIAGPLAATRIFPVAAVQMLRVGESTGSLDIQLEQTADFFSRELEYKIKKLTTVFEPAVIIVMGLIVGFVALALISAMYGVFKNGKIS
jgi:type IV pilus assembly protein PilC